jgi:hypothetical protein
VTSAWIRSIAGVAARIFVGLLGTLLVGGGALLLLAYYGNLTFDVEGVAIALVAAGLLVFLWTRWR